MFLGDGNVKFEFAHVGINAQTPEEGVRMKNFFTEIMGYHDPGWIFHRRQQDGAFKDNGQGHHGPSRILCK